MELLSDAKNVAHAGFQQNLLAAKVLDFIKMPEYTYINISNTLFHPFLALGSISQHFHCTKSVIAAGTWSHLGGTTQKNCTFKQPPYHSEF